MVESKKALTTSTFLTGFEWEPPNIVAESVGNDDGELRRMRSFDGDALLKFTHPHGWTADGVEANGRKLFVCDVKYWIIRWPNRAERDKGLKGPAETIPLVPGGPEYNLSEMNAAVPKTDWTNQYGKPPYQLQRVVELLDGVTLEKLSWPQYTDVKGANAAWREVKDRVKTVHQLRGSDLCPEVELEQKDFPNGYNPELTRPWLRIVAWARFTSTGIEYVDVSKPSTPQPVQIDVTAQSTRPIEPGLQRRSTVDVPLGEECGDAVKY